LTNAITNKKQASPTGFIDHLACVADLPAERQHMGCLFSSRMVALTP